MNPDDTLYNQVRTKASVIKAIQLYNQLGQEPFLDAYGYGKYLTYALLYDGRLYDSKAIFGVAAGFDRADGQPMKSTDFSGGEPVKRRLEELGFVVSSPQLTAHQVHRWWDNQPGENCWIEIRFVTDIGKFLRCPNTSNAYYRLLDAVRPGDIIYHWHAKENTFVGRSVAVSGVCVVQDERYIPLTGFNSLRTAVTRQTLLQEQPTLYKLCDDVRAKFNGPHYLPFQQRNDGLRMMSNYFVKVPQSVVMHLFGPDGWGHQAVQATAPPSESDLETSPLAPSFAYLDPFTPKADTHYIQNIAGGRAVRSRSHETLVNAFGQYLIDQGIQPYRNQAIDIGLLDPPVIIEAKVVHSWAHSTREAIGQLYEYQHFKVANPDAKLVFLASKQVPNEWLNYLEDARNVAVCWHDGDTFKLSAKAQHAIFGGRMQDAP